MTSFVLLVGYSPFEHENREMVCQQIKAGAWSFYEPDWRKISREAQDLIEGLLQVDPVERLSASEALPQGMHVIEFRLHQGNHMIDA